MFHNALIVLHSVIQNSLVQKTNSETGPSGLNFPTGINKVAKTTVYIV